MPLDEEQRNLIVTLSARGWSQRAIAAEVHASRKAVRSALEAIARQRDAGHTALPRPAVKRSSALVSPRSSRPNSTSSATTPTTGRDTSPTPSLPSTMASRDDIWLVDFGESSPGEPAHHRPALVVGPAPVFGANFPFTILVPMTTTRRVLALHVEVEQTEDNGLPEVACPATMTS